MRRVVVVAIAGAMLVCGTSGAAAWARQSRSAQIGGRLVIRDSRWEEPTQSVELIDDAGWSTAVEHRVEVALTAESRQLSRWWGTPVVSFDGTGWPLIATAGPAPVTCGCLGIHTVDTSGRPYAEAWITSHPTAQSTAELSHELLEMLVDPDGLRVMGGTLAEVCDPVSNETYPLDGVMVADFVYPSWFTPGATGPYDALRLPISPLTSRYGQFPDGHPPAYPSHGSA